MTGSEPAETTAATFCATLVDEWVRAGLTDAVVAPGSRSAPLAMALAADARVRLQVHHDERSAGFMALGMGMATGRPALVLCTSGTAAVELHAAVVEAHEAKVPMLVCTADRPPELHGVGAPQTIDQQRLYGRATRWFVDPGVPDPAMAGSWRSLAAQAYVASVAGPPGPVHLDLRFRDPLVGRPGPLPPGRDQGRPWHRAQVGTEPDPATVAVLADAVAGRRGVVVAGGGIDDPSGVHALAEALGWPVLADPRSGCRLAEARTISHFDALLRVPALAEALAPQVVLRLGSPPASKVLGRWLAQLDAWQVAIDAHGTRYDPDRNLDGLVAGPPGATCAAMAARLTGSAAAGTDEWVAAWAHADAVAAESIGRVLARHARPTEPATAREVLAALPDGSALVVSSSMPVRDLEWFSSPRAGVAVLANRGANGIDGVVSTAVGVAVSRAQVGGGMAAPGSAGARGDRGEASGPTALLIGDVALLHDSNGLLGAARRHIDLTIVVVDNDGGGIFSFLPQAEALDLPDFERLFGTPHGVDLIGLAAAHGISGRRLARADEVGDAVQRSVSLGGVHLLVVPTDRAENVAVHAEIDAAVSAALT